MRRGARTGASHHKENHSGIHLASLMLPDFTKETHYAKEFEETLAPSDPLFRFKEAVLRSGIAFDVGAIRYFPSAE